MSRKLPLIASFLALFSLSVPVMAQRTTGNIVGVVSDETGAILPGVTVTIAGQYLMASQTATSTASGRYRFPNLPPGPYTLTFSLTGFASLTRSDLRLETGATLEVNVVLKLSQVAESVTVTGEQPVVDVRSSEISTNYDREWVENAPLPRFTFFDLINAAPGISQNDSQDSRSTALGSGTDENSYMLDGTDFTSPFTGAAWPWPNTDAIAEVEVLSLGAPAEYGNLSGAVFNITTRQGSNDFHGDVNYYYQSEGLTACDFKFEAHHSLVPMETFLRCAVTEPLAGPCVELLCDTIAVALRERCLAGALRQVLS